MNFKFSTQSPIPRMPKLANFQLARHKECFEIIEEKEESFLLNSQSVDA